MDLKGLLNAPASDDKKASQAEAQQVQRTPSQAPGAQCPFPQHASQSPSVAQPPSQYGPYSATTPGARPPSHGYQYPQPSPGAYPHAFAPPNAHLQQTFSHSPTPPSHHSQTPHSVRQSPHSTLSQGPPQHPPPQYQYQHSQPGTPLGPPPLHYRTSAQGHQDLHSPYHQRTSSGTSIHLVSGSPAQHHPRIGNLMDSPSAYNRPSPHLRRTSDYLNSIDRERSVSVSPKTKVLPRALSQGSRQSSQQDVPSARSSLQYQQQPLAEVRGHVIGQPSLHDVAQPQSSSSQSEVAQAQAQAQAQGMSLSQSAQTPYSAINPSTYQQAQVGGSLSQHHQPQPVLQHQSQRMDMNRLLTPANSVDGMDGAADGMAPKQRKQEQPSIFMKPSPKPKRPAVAPPPAAKQQVSHGQDGSGAAEAEAVEMGRQEQAATAAPSGDVQVKQEPLPKPTMTGVKPSNKRAADSEPPTEAPPAKRGKMRKYEQKPIWARRHHTNPKYNAQVDAVNGAALGGGVRQQAPQYTQRPVNGTHPQQPPNGVKSEFPPPQHAQHPQTNGHPPPPASENETLPPPLQNPPLDNDLIQARRLLGPWEKTITWNTPAPGILTQVTDFLFLRLNELQDIPFDPKVGNIEIEAKIGRILKAGTGERLQIPIMAPTVLEPGWAESKTSFESQMDEREFKAMNTFLNEAIKQSHEPGRVVMKYEHPKQTDSFRPLSQAGFDALPSPFKRHARRGGEDLKLRTSTNNNTGQVDERIVKIKIADLHIYNPTGDYDCRITVNVEAQLTDMHPYTDLIEDWQPTQRITPDRKKDRLSYKHLVYSIDLTRVSVEGLQPKYELELEVWKPEVLREQMRRMAQGEGNAFVDVVSGFVDNATWLMRQRAAPAGQ